MIIDLGSLIAPTAPVEDPVEASRRALEVLKAERDRRLAVAIPKPTAPAVEQINARIERDQPEFIDELPEAQLTPREHEEAADNLAAIQCMRSLAEFVRRAWYKVSGLAATPLEWGPHLDAICLHIQGQLEDSAAKRLDLNKVLRAQNLLINCPPRSLKTVIIALASAWAWIRWPWMQILYVSATPKNVLDTARYFRDAVTCEWYRRLFVRGAWEIRGDQDALSSIGNTAGGARRGFGWSANILGQNADWLQIDDAHAMDDSADSIKSALEHYDGNISSRMSDPRTGIRTAIMQRAARGDFSDHVLGHEWFHLRMPMEFELRPECRCPQCALCEPRTPNAFGWVDWREEDGEIIHPRFTREYLNERMRVLRPHGYAGQMQQRPSPKEGNQFKVKLWRFALIEGTEELHPRPHGAHAGAPIVIRRRASDHAIAPGRLDLDWVCLSVDATGGSTSEDASALGLVGGAGKAERRIILGDYTPGPRSWGQTMSDIKLALIKLANLTAWNDRLRVLVEHKALGEAAMGQLKEAIADGKLKDMWGRVIHAGVEPYEPTGKGDKAMRASIMEPMMDAELMFLLAGAEWLTVAPKGAGVTLVDEFAAFPKGQRDDRVDAMSQMVDRYRKKASDWARLFGAPT